MDKIPQVYQQRNTFYYKVNINGHRVTRKAEGSTLAQAQRHVDRLYRTNKLDSPTHASVLASFMDPETNPRYKDARITGKQYTARYADMIAVKPAELDSLLSKGIPSLYYKPIEEVSRKECKTIMYFLVEKEGLSYRAMKFFKMVKLCFGQAADEGLVPANPASGLPDIHPAKTTEKLPISSSDIKRLIHESFLSSQKEQDTFIVLACTGMRIGELAALSARQYDQKSHILVIDQAMKDYNYKEIGKPKWGYCRTIPLPVTAQDSMMRLCTSAHPDGRLYHYSQNWFENVIRRLSANAMLQQGWETPDAIKSMTPHILRHSLNTNLRLESRLPDLVVAEYLSWQHQPENSVQAGYTHLYAENLRPVADAIDEMYGVSEKILQFAVR